jgi:hypothetical protein
VFAVVALVAGELVGFVAFLAGQAILGDLGDVPHAALGQPGVLRAVAAAGPYLALVGLLGLAVGVVVRSAAGGITILVVATLLMPNIGQFFGGLFRYWPLVAGLWSLTTRASPGQFAAWAGLGLQAACVAVTLAAAFVVFRRRDA